MVNCWVKPLKVCLVLWGANPSRISTQMTPVMQRKCLAGESKHNTEALIHFFPYASCGLKCKSLFSSQLSQKEMAWVHHQTSQHLIIFIRGFSGLPSGLHKALASLIGGTDVTLLFSSECLLVLGQSFKKKCLKIEVETSPTLTFTKCWNVSHQGLQNRLSSCRDGVVLTLPVTQDWEAESDVALVNIEYTWSPSTSTLVVYVCAALRTSTWQQRYVFIESPYLENSNNCCFVSFEPPFRYETLSGIYYFKMGSLSIGWWGNTVS